MFGKGDWASVCQPDLDGKGLEWAPCGSSGIEAIQPTVPLPNSLSASKAGGNDPVLY